MDTIKKPKLTAQLTQVELTAGERGYAQAISEIAHDLNTYFCRLLYKQANNLVTSDRNPRSKDGYEYIPADPYSIMRALKMAKLLVSSKTAPTFMDYGCGPGLTMKLAQKEGFRSFGIDIVQEYLDFVNLNSGKTELADLLDKKTYKGRSYDVVYFYCPLCNHKARLDFEKLVLPTCKDILIPFGTFSFGKDTYNNGEHPEFKLLTKLHSDPKIYKRCK